MESFFSFIIGASAIAVAIINDDWIFERRRTKFLVSLMGRTAARVVIGICGFMMVIGSFTL